MALSNKKIERIDIEEELLEKATECHKKFSCLDCEKRSMCEAEYGISKDFIFVKRNGSPYCNYRIFYGDGTICHCPVRVAIYNRYRI
ncbi:MAG: hypothetical protein DRN33_00405 [Thermoplasmata archaeon]|nr:MAG: hypothetical protein DRN33_00405 [Thermoplasmata archaeon]